MATSLATPPPVSTSKGFHLLLVPHDASPARPLSTIHTGAGQSLAVTGAPSDELVFYQNSTGGDASFVTDVLPQGFPMSFAFGEGGEGEDGGGEEEGGEEGGGGMWPVKVTVSEATRGVFVSEEEYDPWVYTSGAFYICEQWVEYYETTYPVLNWSDGADEEVEGNEEGGECVRVGVIPVCEVLDELPADALGSHEFVEVVRCFVDDQSASLSTRG